VGLDGDCVLHEASPGLFRSDGRELDGGTDWGPVEFVDSGEREDWFSVEDSSGSGGRETDKATDEEGKGLFRLRLALRWGKKSIRGTTIYDVASPRTLFLSFLHSFWTCCS
jgi:hypothetical protein